MPFDIELPWSEFKSNCLDTGKYSWLHFVRADCYVIFAKQNTFTALCKLNLKNDLADKEDFETNYLPKSGAVLKSKVVTEFELDDKTLGLISMIGDFVDNECLLEMEIPGTVGGVGRYVKEGYAFTDSYAWGTRIKRIALVDKNYLYAGALYPAEPAPGITWAQAAPYGVELGDYADLEVAEEHRGWRFWAEEGGQGGSDVDSLAGYGNLLAGCFLTLLFQKPESSSPTKVAVNIQWGVPNA